MSSVEFHITYTARDNVTHVGRVFVAAGFNDRRRAIQAAAHKFNVPTARVSSAVRLSPRNGA